MNQEKIGNFIKSLRKEKNMTQNELALKLGVTDKAISKWENGRGLPDLSLIKDVSDILGVTVNELLTGEKLDSKEEVFENNIINTINYTNNKIKSKNKYIIILSLTIVVILTFLSFFIIDVNKMRKGEDVLFSTWGFKYISSIKLDEVKITNAIEDYILKLDGYYDKDNAKYFVCVKNLYIKTLKNKQLVVYSYVYEESFYLKNDILTSSSGSSNPYKFILEKKDDNYFVVSYETPDDMYSNIDDIFPSYVLKKIYLIHDDNTIDLLQNDVYNKAKLYYHK